MENQQIPNGSSSLDNFFNIAFDENTRAEVRKAAQWARICTLCAFIGIALIVAFFGKTASVETEEGMRVSAFARTGSIIGTLITVGIGVWINYYLYRFSEATAKGMNAMDSMKTNEGFESLRVYFKILGILLIIGLCFGGLFLLFALLRRM
jgi:hypothetical protein